MPEVQHKRALAFLIYAKKRCEKQRECAESSVATISWRTGIYKEAQRGRGNRLDVPTIVLFRKI
jgi:hypothetical protein